jgi:DnaJ like chaperone protein
MEVLLSLIGSLFTIVGFVVYAVIVLILAFVAGVIAFFKGRSFLLWFVITLFFPLAILIIFILPRKTPKFGSFLDDHEAFRGKNPVAASMMALAAIVAKADGHVTEGEVATIKKFIAQNFRMTQSEMMEYKGAFEYGKNHPDEYKEFTRVIKTYYRTRNTIIALSYLLFDVGYSDGDLAPQQEEMIKKILFDLGMSEYEYTSIKNSFVNGNGGNGYGPQASESELIKKYSQVLGVSEDASMSEIKSAYRKLMKEYHPDKVSGMPEEYVEFAHKKTIEINEAYDYLKKMK